MDLEQFRTSLRSGEAPARLSAELKALWLDASGDWESAHQLVQERESRSCARVHAYLHRKEGDRSNADYWYGRACEQGFDGSLEQEWEVLVVRFLLGATT